MPPRYYTYELVVTPSEKVCYVGKGQGTRMEQHRKVVQKMIVKEGYQPASSRHLYRKLKELVLSGQDFYPRKVFESDSAKEVLDEETKKILSYGVESLFNIKIHDSDKHGDLISKALKIYAEDCKKIYGKGCTPKASLNRSLNAAKFQPKVSEKLKLAHARGDFAHWTPKFCEAGRAAQKKNGPSDHRRQALSKALKGRKVTSETRAKLIASKKARKIKLGYFYSPEVRAKMSLKRKGQRLGIPCPAMSEMYRIKRLKKIELGLKLTDNLFIIKSLHPKEIEWLVTNKLSESSSIIKSYSKCIAVKLLKEFYRNPDKIPSKNLTKTELNIARKNQLLQSIGVNCPQLNALSVERLELLCSNEEIINKTRTVASTFKKCNAYAEFIKLSSMNEKIRL